MVFSKEENLENIFFFTNPAPWSKLFKRQFILDKKIYFQNLRNANDLKFTLTALAEADRIVAIDKVLVYYRTNHGTSLQQTKDTDPTCICDALLGLKTELVSRGLFEKLKSPYYTAVAKNLLYNLRTLHSRQAFETLYCHIKTFLAEELHLITEAPETFTGFSCEKDREEFVDIYRLEVDDYMCKYELFGMKKPVDIVKEEENQGNDPPPPTKNSSESLSEKTVQQAKNIEASTKEANEVSQRGADKVISVGNQEMTKVVNKKQALCKKVHKCYKTNVFWETSRKIFSRLLRF